MIGIARHLDVHGTLVDDDDDQDLRGIGDRGESLEDLDALEAFGAAKPLGDRVEGAGVEGRAEADAGEAAHLLVARQHVAVNLDGGDDLVGRDGPAKAGRPVRRRYVASAFRRTFDRCEHQREQRPHVSCL
jgi:hypothetical protein